MDFDGSAIAATAASGAGETRQVDGGAVVCSLRGDLDLDGLGPARSLLTEALGSGAALLVSDLEGVGFCDSSGLNMLLQLRLDAQRAGVSFRLAAPSGQMRRLFEITGAGAVFAVDDTVADALAHR